MSQKKNRLLPRYISPQGKCCRKNKRFPPKTRFPPGGVLSVKKNPPAGVKTEGVKAGDMLLRLSVKNGLAYDVSWLAYQALWLAY